MIKKQQLKNVLFYIGYGVAILTISSLFLLVKATEGSATFEHFYQTLLILILAGICCLLFIVLIYLAQVIKDYKNRVPGSRLLVGVLWRSFFLAFLPLILISFFAFKFLRYEFQSSFDEGINNALNNALLLSQKALNLQGLQALEESIYVANQIADYEYIQLQTQIESIRSKIHANEMAVFDEKGFIQAFTSADYETLIPEIPEHSDFNRADASGGIFVIESSPVGLQIRTLTTIHKLGFGNFYLQTIFLIPDSISALANQVSETISERDHLHFLMPKVNQSFIFVLLLVVLLASLLIFLSSIKFAGNMAAPIHDLLKGTINISAGNFNNRLLQTRRDDFGTLIQAFNGMTESLNQATKAAEDNKNRVENERAYLETVIEHITAGVITLDDHYGLETYNASAAEILKVSLNHFVYQPVHLLEAGIYHQFITAIIEKIKAQTEVGKESEINIDTDSGQKRLMLRITPLPANKGIASGYVVIFDEVGEYFMAQKQAAWAEVARRLAHEIKNPLTPILLAAERLNYKLSQHLEEKEREILNRSITVISNQVESLKQMVDDFSNYAKPSQEKTRLHLHKLLQEVLDLYKGHYQQIQFNHAWLATEDVVLGNANQLRQLLHNILKNAIEAIDSQLEKTQMVGEISLSSENQNIKNQGGYFVLKISDNGVGLASEENIFDPYITTKEKGTGLGLAIVKKIVQEHRGKIELKNQPTGGVLVVIQIPLFTRVDS